MKRSQKGFSVVELIIAVVIIGLLVGIGYTAFNRISKEDATSTQQTTTQQTTTQQTESNDVEVPEIQSAADLDTTETTLENIDLEADSAELDQLDEALNTF